MCYAVILYAPNELIAYQNPKAHYDVATICCYVLIRQLLLAS